VVFFFGSAAVSAAVSVFSAFFLVTFFSLGASSTLAAFTFFSAVAALAAGLASAFGFRAAFLGSTSAG
jgi:hypothetical protein